MTVLFPRVVLVDDNEDDNFIHKTFLRRAGWTKDVICFTGGREAMSLLPTLEPVPSVVFLDLNMPESTGFEVLASVRDWAAAQSGTAIVILTSSLHPDDRTRAESDPLIHAYVEKPLNLEALEALRRTLAD